MALKANISNSRSSIFQKVESNESLTETIPSHNVRGCPSGVVYQYN